MDDTSSDIRRKRLLYRSNYRGFKEADIILGGFAKRYMATLTEAELSMFEDLLSEKDHDIYDWILGKKTVPAYFDTPLLKRLQDYAPEF